MTKLTKLQLQLLQAAANSVDGFIASPNGEAGAKAIAGLIKAGMMISIPAEGQDSRPMITDKGRAALPPPQAAIDAPAPAATKTGKKPPKAADEPAPAPGLAPPSQQQPKGKIAALVALLSRGEGATIADMMAATGWQAHSVRGAISGSVKKALGLTVSSDKTEAGRVYRIVQEAA